MSLQRERTDWKYVTQTDRFKTTLGEIWVLEMVLLYSSGCPQSWGLQICVLGLGTCATMTTTWLLEIKHLLFSVSHCLGVFAVSVEHNAWNGNGLLCVLCVYVSVVCVSVVCTVTCLWRPEFNISVFLNCPPPYFFLIESPWIWSILTRMAASDAVSLPSPVLRLQTHATLPYQTWLL